MEKTDENTKKPETLNCFWPKIMGIENLHAKWKNQVLLPIYYVFFYNIFNLSIISKEDWFNFLRQNKSHSQKAMNRNESTFWYRFRLIDCHSLWDTCIFFCWEKKFAMVHSYSCYPSKFHSDRQKFYILNWNWWFWVSSHQKSWSARNETLDFILAKIFIGMVQVFLHSRE